MGRHRAFAFTINNFTEEDILFCNTLECRYIIYGREVAPTTGTQHLQGYVYFTNAREFKSILEKHKKWHLEVAKGSAEQNIKYCKKEGNFVERGEAPKQGKRTDIDNIKEMVLEKKPMSEIVMEANSYQALKFAELATYHLYEDRTDKPYVTWIWGLSGTGKTKFVHDNHEDIYIKDGTQWWNGYNQQEVICIDDFDGKWPFRDLLRLLDRYKYQGQTKGGYVKINSPFIYITCEYHPEHFWNGNTYQQVFRRIDEIIKMTHTEVGGNTNVPDSEKAPAAQTFASASAPEVDEIGELIRKN